MGKSFGCFTGSFRFRHFIVFCVFFLVERTLVKADLHRSGPSLKRTFVEADLCRSGHWSIIKQGGGHQSIISKIGHSVNSIDSYYTKFRWQRLENFLNKMLTHILCQFENFCCYRHFGTVTKSRMSQFNNLFQYKNISTFFNYLHFVHRPRSTSTKVRFDEGPLQRRFDEGPLHHFFVFRKKIK